MNNRWHQIVTHPTKFTPALRVLNPLASFLVFASIACWVLRVELISLLIDAVIFPVVVALIVVTVCDARARR